MNGPMNFSSSCRMRKILPMSKPTFPDEASAPPVDRVCDDPESFEHWIARLPVMVAVVDLLHDYRQPEQAVDLV